jgi:hypothetical protein
VPQLLLNQHHKAYEFRRLWQHEGHLNHVTGIAVNVAMKQDVCFNDSGYGDAA